MSKPEPEQIAVLRWDGEDIDWSRNIDSLTDQEIAEWASECLSDFFIVEPGKDPADKTMAEVLIRWSTDTQIDAVVAYRDDSIPPYGRELHRTDADDRLMLERGERITALMLGLLP